MACESVNRRGDGNPAWVGGRVMREGYWLVRVDDDDPMAVMRDPTGYVREHRLVAARMLGRPLRTEDEVHHVNRDKTDNRPENLQVMTHAEHSAIHYAEKFGKKATP